MSRLDQIRRMSDDDLIRKPPYVARQIGGGSGI